MKGKCPFRLGTTSFILPAGILENVKHLAGLVDDVELLVFESDEMTELPDAKTLHELKTIAALNALTYTVHLPLDIWLGDPLRKERERSVHKCRRTIEGMKSINPLAWILHCNREGRENSRIGDDREWAAVTDASVAELLKCGVPPESVCVETLDGSFPLLEPMIEKYGLSICLDIGHLFLYALPFEAYLQKYLGQARVIHVHGVKAGRDHQDLSGIDPGVLQTFVSAIRENENRDRVVTLEIFNEIDFSTSMKILESYQ